MLKKSLLNLIFVAIFCLVLVPSTTHAAGLSVSNVNITTQEVPVGTPITVKVDVRALLTTHFYQVQLGLIRGDYPNSGNSKSSCLAMLNGENTANYFASQRDVVSYIPNSDGATFKRASAHSGSDNSVDQNSQFQTTLTPNSEAGDIRLYAVLIDYGPNEPNYAGANNWEYAQDRNPDFYNGWWSSEGENWCNEATTSAGKYYQYTAGKIEPKPDDPNGNPGSKDGGGGGGGGIDYPDIEFGDISTGGIFGVTDPNESTIADPTCAADIKINLPGGRGTVSLENAGILGLCSPRPVLFRLIQVLLTLAYIFFVVAIIYSGIILATADSDDKAVTAKKNLTWAAIGALVVIAANWIVPATINIITAISTP